METTNKAVEIRKLMGRLEEINNAIWARGGLATAAEDLERIGLYAQLKNLGIKNITDYAAQRIKPE
jgi:hypothetical protein